MWGIRNRHRVNLVLTVLLLCATAGVSLLFFSGVGTLGNVPFGAGDNPFKWYHLVSVSNMLALIFLASRGIGRPMRPIEWWVYYTAFGAITLALFGFPVVLWLLGGGPTVHLWLLLGAVVLWNGIFWNVTITYPPTEEAA